MFSCSMSEEPGLSPVYSSWKKKKKESTMIKSKPEIRDELKSSHWTACQQRREHWLCFWRKEKGGYQLSSPDVCPAVFCQCSNDCSFSGLKSKRNNLWTCSGFRELLDSPLPRSYPALPVTCKASSAMNWSAFPDWSCPPAECPCGTQSSGLHVGRGKRGWVLHFQK